ncbi:glycosyltransferase [Sulfitobacter aestuarii]|uniref:Glycosyltransferase n=1 Tax=Sulfitobacter aestuarii TaxID=2161676 RepID=A0ABW5U2E5_9RHOB
MSYTPLKPRIALVDPMCREGYSPASLTAGGLGGTEATVLRIARALGDDFAFTHYQKGRDRVQDSPAGVLRPLCQIERLDAEAIIVINAWKVAVKLRKAHPDLPIFLWLHVHPGRHNRRMGAALHRAGIAVICVSRSHVAELRDFLSPGPLPDILHVYNPIADGLAPDDTPRRRNRLLYASSPHKGLAEVFARFDRLRRALPELTLALADPGYLRWDAGPVPQNVVSLGTLSHAALIRQMRQSLCLFYPQTGFAETFGLVLAEANAVGTPVLAHAGLGANDEVVSTAGQLLDANDPEAILSRIRAWQAAPPRIVGKPCFRLSQLREDWAGILRTALGVEPEFRQVRVG